MPVSTLLGAACSVQAVLNGHVVVGDDRFHFNPFAARQVSRHLKVEHVAGIVLDDVQHARAAIYGLGGLEHLIRRGRSEHRARAGGIKHTDADETAVHRLVTGAAARDHTDARIMTAWPAGCAVWAATMYFGKDWAEIKIGVQTLVVYTAALFVVWLVTLSQYDLARHNGLTFGIAAGLVAALLIFFYWRQEASRHKARV